MGRDALLALQRSAGNRAVQQLVVQRSPGPAERQALVAKIMRLIVARLTSSELFVPGAQASDEEAMPAQVPSLATLASARVAKSLATILKKQQPEGRLPLEWQFLAVGLKPPAAVPAEQSESAMETDLPKTGETPNRSGLPSFVEVGQTESGAPSLGYKPGTRPRVVYANNPASPIGHKTAAIKQFEQQETERLREQASNEGLPVKKQKRSKSSTPRLSGEAQQQLRAAVDARVQADEEQRLRAEFGDVPADLLPTNIKSAELLPELLIPDRTGSDTFHAETRLVYEGCDHVTVSGPPSVTTNEQNQPSFTFGKQYNCVLCSLYRMNHGLPYSFHTDKVKSWFLPEPLGVAEFFGAEIAAVASSPEFVQEFKTKEPFDAQDLINILADKNMPWPKLARGQKELS